MLQKVNVNVRTNDLVTIDTTPNVYGKEMLVVAFNFSIWIIAEGMYPYHIQCIQHLESADMCSWLELCHWINSNPHMIRNILFTDEAYFTCDGVNNTRNSHLWDRDNPHGTVKSNYQHLFAIKVWCGVNGDQIIGPYIFLQRLTGDIYANFLQHELPTFLQHVPLQT